MVTPAHIIEQQRNVLHYRALAHHARKRGHHAVFRTWIHFARMRLALMRALLEN